MFKYSPINSYSLRNLQKNQIFFNNPINFNDPFDTFHPAEFKEISNELFVKFYSRFSKRKFDENVLLEILQKSISKRDFINFCNDHIEYFIDFNREKENEILKSKSNFLSYINNNSEV
ncbi:MAG: hypothetical protein J7K39_02780, partial [Bacteroidales bacterium]|nr:hypothetical protein [Bacteroidales bacterium]